MNSIQQFAESESPSSIERVFYYSDELRSQARRGVLQHLGLLASASLGIVVVPRVIEVFITAAMLWHLQHLVACIRLSEVGISRRVLWWWDLWPWEEFSGGQIQFGRYAHSYRFVNRLFRGTLRFDQLNDDDIQFVNEHIRERLTLPVMTFPHETDFCTSFLGGKFVRMSAEGISVRSFLRKSTYTWSEIEATICRLEADRGDFRHLWLKVRDQYLILEQKEFDRTWSGGSAEEIAAVLIRYIDSSQVHEFTLHGQPQSLEELDARWDYLNAKEQERDQPRVALMMMIAMVLLGVAMFLWLGKFWLAFSMAFSAFSIHSIYRAEVMRVRKRQRDYESQREQLLQAEEVR